MNCRHVENLLEQYADQELAASQEMAVKAHLADCSSCREEYSSLLSVRRALDTHPRITASRDFDMRVLDAVMAQNAQPHAFLHRVAVSFMRPLGELLEAAAMGAVLSLLTIGILLLPQLLSSQSTSRRGPAAATPTSSIAINPYVPRDFNRFYAYNGVPYGISTFSTERDAELFESFATQPATKEPS